MVVFSVKLVVVVVVVVVTRKDSRVIELLSYSLI